MHNSGPVLSMILQKIRYTSVPPDPAYFRELFRVSKHQIIWGINYFPIKNPGPGRIVWDKVRDNGTDFSDCEIAYCSLLQKVRIVRYLWNGMLQGRSIQEGTIMRGNKRQNEKRIHPTQKPVPLYRWLLEQYAAPLADVAPIRILDTHLGSGSIAIACHDLIEEGCHFSLDAAEIDPLYYHAALKRYQDHAQQQSFRFA